MSEQDFRIESDSMGELKVPAGALYGAQTQRAVENFPISGQPMPRRFIAALGLVKACAARANRELGGLGGEQADAIIRAAEAIAAGNHHEHFPVDVFQTGSGTSSNMNANEVIAHLVAAEGRTKVHANDHVNMSQSSNDVIPTTLHVSAAMALHEELLPALAELEATIRRRAKELATVVKTGRTHLMDAMPLTLGQELGAWATQIAQARARLQDTAPRLWLLAQGGTAVGTGINAPAGFGQRVAAALAERTGIAFEAAPDAFERLASQDTAAELSGQLRALATALIKISNDLRWMNSGPLAGLGEIALPALQPGSSIMPGKVNPVIPEAVAMAGAQVMGNDAAIAVAAQSGNFQLNVMLPLIAHNLLQSLELLANASRLLGERVIAGFEVRHEQLDQALSRNPILVTALNTVIGYDQAAAIAKQAYADGRPILEVARELTGLDESRLRALLDPAQLTRGGIPGR
ncbi:class II fumarate hydratase [Alkalilimnicola sp. S0819]|uniref:class II fumarate hydratase n=1 Tax=Alkalilimnicola sp. S0819 TaxID=2613922 RepID=UPI00126169FC|nr:class II fumarate hydratase [Alkalilimnicola sp. S0819]KAB7627571.1 class II fumarate hydratase [Alkalilimnicola sp. S0819]MPQ15728.1 aspartate ammonia-lyase [Alkalilimnicola sp. S0819]